MPHVDNKKFVKIFETLKSLEFKVTIGQVEFTKTMINIVGRSTKSGREIFHYKDGVLVHLHDGNEIKINELYVNKYAIHKLNRKLIKIESELAIQKGCTNKIVKKTQRINQFISKYPIDAAIVNLLNIEKYQY